MIIECTKCIGAILTPTIRGARVERDAVMIGFHDHFSTALGGPFTVHGIATSLGNSSRRFGQRKTLVMRRISVPRLNETATVFGGMRRDAAFDRTGFAGDGGVAFTFSRS